MKTAWIMAGAAALAVGVSGVASADTVKLGMINTTSGPFARWGVQFNLGIKAFQKENGTSVNGNEIQVISRDVGGNDPVKSKQLAQDLILKDKVQFLAGFEFTPTAVAIADIITQAKMPTIIWNAATSSIVRTSPYFIRTSFTVAQTALPVAQWALKNGIKTAVTAVADYAPGYDSEEYFNTPFKKGGGQVLDDIRIPLSTTDFSPVFEKILNEHPQAVYIFGPGGPAGIAMVQTWASRLEPAGIKLLCGGCVSNLDMPNFGDAAIGAVSSTYYETTIKNKVNERMIADVHALFPNDTPDAATVNAYDGLRLIYMAVQKFGPKVTGDQALSLWKGLQIDSPRGPLMIDADTRDVVDNIYMMRVVKQDGKVQEVPFDTIPMVKDPWKFDHPS